MTNPRQLFDQHDLRPKKKLGQNFLHDPNTLEKIVEIAQLRPDNIVVEVGTGTGTLTCVLAQTAHQVFTVEVDDRLVPILEQ